LSVMNADAKSTKSKKSNRKETLTWKILLTREEKPRAPTNNHFTMIGVRL
jgi:hypothetical protein